MNNTGHTVLVRVSDSEVPVYLRGGPLVYSYTFSEIIFHWAGPDNLDGSEHSINHHSFPAEIQIFGYNSDLYDSMSVARQKVRGLVAVSLMVQLEDGGARLEQEHSRSHSGLGAVLARLANIKYRGEQTNIPRLSLAHIIPSTGEFITYEGSTTYPGCWETVTWIVMNKPLYVSRQEMEMFYQLRQGDGPVMEKAPLGNNLRPRQPVNNRAVRTNIALTKHQTGGGTCSQDLPRIVYTTSDWIHGIDTANTLV